MENNKLKFSTQAYPKEGKIQSKDSVSIIVEASVLNNITYYRVTYLGGVSKSDGILLTKNPHTTIYTNYSHRFEDNKVIYYVEIE
jgi:hypothetical protein